MLIALDWDGTVTADEELWFAFVRLATARGHKVFIATARNESDVLTIREKIEPLGIRVIATNGKPKIKEVDDQAGFLPDIWIDDQPELLFAEIRD